ncbi:MAG: AAA family ATPase [Mangrovibacterium sp.]
MILRQAETELQLLADQFKAVAVVGPRQSGKTTLVRKIFSEKPYANLENPDLRRFAIEDPRGFLSGYPQGAVLDEIQRAPDLFSYLQQILDDARTKGS